MSMILGQRGTSPASNGKPHSIARTTRLTGFQILSTGSYLPEKIVTNEDLREQLGFDGDWIFQRTGIRERRHAPEHMATSDLGYEAATRCLESAYLQHGIRKDEIDMLVVGTFTPDMSFPSVACNLQDRLRLRCGGFDIQAACAGFMYALSIGAQFVKTGSARLCLVVGADCNSRILNPTDLKTYPIFGDGAGAVLLGAGSEDQGYLSYQLGSDGSGGDLLSRPAGGSRLPFSAAALDADLQYMHMDGRAVFRWAVNTVTDSTNEVLRYAGLTAEDISLFVPHQANVRIINAVSDVLGFPRSRVFNNIHLYGNTSAGSIPIALDEAITSGMIQRGDRLLMSGFGAGLSWGSAVLQW